MADAKWPSADERRLQSGLIALMVPSRPRAEPSMLMMSIYPECCGQR